MDLSNSTAALPSNSTRKVVETKTVYVFDPMGILLGEYCSVTTCAKKLNLGRPRINAGLQRGSIVDSRYYISYEKEFNPKCYNYAHNPLVPRMQHPRGSRSQTGFLSDEFFEVIC